MTSLPSHGPLSGKKQSLLAALLLQSPALHSIRPSPLYIIMSRSALWRQEANVVERQRQAKETFQLALEEGNVSFFNCRNY